MNDATLPERLYAYLPALLSGAGYTLMVSAVAILAGFVLGAMLLGMSLAGGGRGPLPALVRLYVSFFRGTPLLVQLLMMFYLPAAAGIEPPPLVVAMAAMALNSAAFQCEILRAGLTAIPAGQMEAALSFGIGPRRIFRYIQLPQLARAVWPAVVSEAIDVIKNSAIVSVIAVADLARAGRQIVAANFRTLEVYLTVGLCYLLMTAAVFALGNWMARRMRGERSLSARVLNRRTIRT